MNAVGAREEKAAREKVRKMGLNPDTVLASPKG